MRSAERVVTPAPGSPDAQLVRGAVGGLPVPARAEGVELLGDMRGSGYKNPPALVRRGDGQTITLTPLLYVLLRAIDGNRSCDEISARLSTALGRSLSPDDVCYLIDEKLRPLGLLRSADGVEPVYQKANPLLALRLKFVLTNPVLTRRITAPFAVLFNPLICLPLVAAFAFVTWWLFADKGLASAIHGTFYNPGMVLVVWALVLLSAGFHEFGHAAATRYGGARPGAMGAGLYLVWPAFYTDVTDSYRLGRGGRLRVDLGGLYFNAIFAMLTLAAWSYFDQDALLLVVGAQHLQMIKQLAPFIRADGYHIVADLTGVPDLFAHIKPTLASVLPRRFRPTAPPALKPWARAIVIGWVLLVVPLLVGLLLAAVLLLPRLAGTAWDSMQIQWDAVGHHWVEGDPAGVVVRLLSSVIVALPVLALLYLLVRLARRFVVRAWVATRGKRLRRVGLIAVLAAVIAALVWIWWPRDDNYRPIKADENIDIPTFIAAPQPASQTVVPMAVPAARTSVQVLPLSYWVPLYTQPTPTVLPLVQALHETNVLSTSTTSPLDNAPTPTPTTGAGAPPAEDAWPFPFPGPAPAREGDNQAVAVNTTDGTVVTDFVVAWAIATAQEIDYRNEAWALASCTDCVARAVAFQALLILGDVPAIAPVNIAAAANYECTRCVTEALAVQLVVTITGMPSEQALAEIAAAMNRVEQLEKDIDKLSMGQILYAIQATELQILSILEKDGKLPDVLTGAAPSSDVGSGGTSIAGADGTTDGGPGEAGAPEAAGDAGATSPTPEGDTTDGATTSSSPTESAPPSQTTSESPAAGEAAGSEPSPEPSTEPTPEPTAATTEPTTATTDEPTTGPTTEPSGTDPATTEPSASP